MEQAGFSRAGVAGEYSPLAVQAQLTTDVNSAAAFATILTTSATILEAGEVLNLLLTYSGNENVFGGSFVFRINVDGVPYRGFSETTPVGGAWHAGYRILSIPDLIPGPHSITVDWRDGSPSKINAGSDPFHYYLRLQAFRNVPLSRREMDGVPAAGWPMIYTLGSQVTELAAAATSTTTTVTTPLFSNVLVQTRYPQSALLIRFSACAVSNDGTNTLDNQYQILVDGVPAVGTTCTTGAAGGISGAGAIVVVPVQAGVHSINVNWAGGAAPGSTINPTLPLGGSGDVPLAELNVEEVFCSDVCILSDMETFAAYAFASRNLPRVGFSQLTTDFTNGGASTPLLTQLFTVSSEQAAVLIEATACNTYSGGTELNIWFVVDGVTYSQAHKTGATNQGQFAGNALIVNLTQGNHLIQLWVNALISIKPVTFPASQHCNMVVREIAPIAS